MSLQVEKGLEKGLGFEAWSAFTRLGGPSLHEFT